MQTTYAANPLAVEPPVSNVDIRLLVVDIDGTIAGESNDVREPVKQAIQAAQAKGIQVAIATGRMYRSALRFYKAIGADLPILAYQGAWIQDPKTEKLYQHVPVPQPLALELVDYYEQPEWRSQISVHCYINDQLYIREWDSHTKDYSQRSSVQPITVGDLRSILTEAPTKILALSNNIPLIDQLLANLRQRYTPAELYTTKSVPTFLEANNPGINKGIAVRYLAEEVLGLQASQVMAIGDNFNDLEMLEYAGVGVAMGNAPAGVQSIAQWVAPDVEEDGAAAAIEKFLL